VKRIDIIYKNTERTILLKISENLARYRSKNNFIGLSK